MEGTFPATLHGLIRSRLLTYNYSFTYLSPFEPGNTVRPVQEGIGRFCAASMPSHSGENMKGRKYKYHWNWTIP